MIYELYFCMKDAKLFFLQCVSVKITITEYEAAIK